MTKLEILQSFLQDEILQKEYGITEKEINKIGLNTANSSEMVSLIQNLIMTVEDTNKSPNSMASSINRYLNNKLNN